MIASRQTTVILPPGANGASAQPTIRCAIYTRKSAASMWP